MSSEQRRKRSHAAIAAGKCGKCLRRRLAPHSKSRCKHCLAYAARHQRARELPPEQRANPPARLCIQCHKRPARRKFCGSGCRAAYRAEHRPERFCQNPGCTEPARITYCSPKCRRERQNDLRRGELAARRPCGICDGDHHRSVCTSPAAVAQPALRDLVVPVCAGCGRTGHNIRTCPTPGPTVTSPAVRSVPILTSSTGDPR